jgi:plasmid stabilization system protein ParE
MTAYTVTWHRQALDELTEVWTAAGQRQAVTDSVHRIDRVLRVDPAVKGVDFYGDRLLVVLPLAVVYSVREQDRMVEILTVTASRDM